MTLVHPHCPTSFPQELPSRVLKSILRTADEDSDGYISIEEAEHAFERMGVADKLTREEIAEAMEEIGAADGRIEVQVIKDMLTDQRGM